MELFFICRTEDIDFFLSFRQAELKRQVDTLQWEMSEKTAEITDLQEQLSIVKPVTTPGDDSNQGEQSFVLNFA